MDALATGGYGGQARDAAHAPIVVTLVHGTFAKGAAWTKPDSILRGEIATALGEHEQNVAFDVFEWSGRNSYKARVKAGYELADHIRRLRGRIPHCRHFIVAHSHGGNVALLAHKHLPVELHALGVATLGTPFLFARLRGDLALHSMRSLEREAVQENQIAAAMFAFVMTIASIAIFGNYYEDTLANAWYWACAVGLGIGYVSRPLFQKFITPHLVRGLFRISGKRAAKKLADAIAFERMPQTHILSFSYPRDEAGLLLDSLELTTKAPTWVMDKVMGFGLIAAGLIVIAGPIVGFSTAALETFVGGFDGERVGELIAMVATALIMGTAGVFLLFGAIRYVLSLLRGHPAGFGWERPSIHNWADIGATPAPEVPEAKSLFTETVPYHTTAKGGLRHSGLYEDTRILNAIAYWMAHVR